MSIGITKFCSELYDCKSMKKEEMSSERRFHGKPEFMPEEIRQVTEDLKKNKSSGHNKITNEQRYQTRGTALER